MTARSVPSKVYTNKWSIPRNNENSSHSTNCLHEPAKGLSKSSLSKKTSLTHATVWCFFYKARCPRCNHVGQCLATSIHKINGESLLVALFLRPIAHQMPKNPEPCGMCPVGPGAKNGIILQKIAQSVVRIFVVRVFLVQNQSDVIAFGSKRGNCTDDGYVYPSSQRDLLWHRDPSQVPRACQRRLINLHEF